MTTGFTIAGWIGMAVVLSGASLPAQMRENTEKHLNCTDSGYDNGRARHCEMREQTLPAIGRLNVDGGANGGVSIKGWARNEVLVRTRIEATAENAGAAANLASRVAVDANGGMIKATGPESNRDSGWSAGYEIFVPHSTDLTMKANNGGVSVADVRGQLHVETRNGGVNLKRVEGDIQGETANGGIDVELAGANWNGRQMDLKTRNGGVQVSLPATVSANIVAETGLGGIQSDFPMPRNNSRERVRRVEFAVGAGGPAIHITTGNGGIRLKSLDAQQ